MGKYIDIEYSEKSKLRTDAECAKWGNCELCGEYLDKDPHHVILKSQGGHDEKKIRICRKCHNWIHYHPLEAKKRGLYGEKE